MASYQQLQDEVSGWLNRRDIGSLIAGWVAMVETEIAETCRTRPQVVSGVQPIDNAYITLPVDFCAMASIRDAVTGEMLVLKDEWSGHWTDYFPASPYAWLQPNPRAPSTAYRLVENCIEFMPHPIIPDPPDPAWKPQNVLMAWYAKPKPLLLPSDTNVILENFYGIYLWGCLKLGALFELDDDRAAQADTQMQSAVTRANMYKQQSDYSGAPFREEMAVKW